MMRYSSDTSKPKEITVSQMVEDLGEDRTRMALAYLEEHPEQVVHFRVGLNLYKLVFEVELDDPGIGEM